MEWIPHGVGTSVSNDLTGEGFYPIDSLTLTGLDAPFDGLIVHRFDLSFGIQSFDPSRIWNASSAFATQLRGGRLVLQGREGLSEELFINRAQTRFTNLIYFDTDFSASTLDEVGAGSIEISVDPFGLGGRYCQSVLYGLEPGVVGRVRVLSSWMILYNPADLYRFQLTRY